MPSFLDDNDDLLWYLRVGVDWEPLVRLTEYDWQAEDGFRSTADAVELYSELLGLVGTFAAERIAPRAAELDRQHPRLVDGEVVEGEAARELTRGLVELGLPALCLPRELGGTNAPLLCWHLSTELLARADVSLAAHLGFHGGMAMAALMYSVLEGSTRFQQSPPRIIATRFAECIEEIAQGRAWGSMDLTEPQAGSDLAAITTRARLHEDGTWRLNGQKIFITSGHGRWHFVLAKTEDGVGLDALSMFLVPAWDRAEDGGKLWRARFVGVEEKLGHHASATVAIAFEDTPGQLIGQRGEGFKLMLLLMNNARVAVGFESLGLCEAALRKARAYAAQRPSMGRTIDRHEMVAELLEGMQTEIQGIRALAVQAAWHEELAQKARLALAQFPLHESARAELERSQKEHARKARAYTPLLKWLASESAVEIARQGIQIHGGAGYIRETGAEKYLRDAMVLPIYEGTSQIQALMAMKDTLLGAVRDPAGFARRAAAARLASASARDPLRRQVALLRVRANQAVQHLLSRLLAGKVEELRLRDIAHWAEQMRHWDPKRDFGLAMLHAERLTGLLADAAVAKVLLAQAQKDPARREVLVRWLERALPRSRYRLDQITGSGSRLLARLAEGG